MQDWMSKLERAKALLDAGALTPEEFDAEKARLMPSASVTYVEHVEHHVEGPPEVDATPTFGWSKIGGFVVLVIAAATTVYLLLRDRSPAPSSDPPQIVAPQPTASNPITGATPVARPAPVHTPAEAEFGCLGAYSNVSFSEESGDGSGLFLRIGKSGQITWKYYEGSISRGNVEVNELSASRITATVRYLDYPSEPPSSVVLQCNDGQLSASSPNIGNLSLRRLTATEAAALDL